MLKFCHRVVALWALVGGVGLLAIMIVTTADVLLFAVVKGLPALRGHVSGISGYEDFVSLAMASAVPMFLPLCQLRHGHIVVNLLDSVFGEGLRRGLDRLWLLATAGLAVFLLYWGWLGLIETRGDHSLSPILGWPVWPFLFPAVASCGLWAVVAVCQLFSTDENALSHRPGVDE